MDLLSPSQVESHLHVIVLAHQHINHWSFKWSPSGFLSWSVKPRGEVLCTTRHISFKIPFEIRHQKRAHEYECRAYQSCSILSAKVISPSVPMFLSSCYKSNLKKHSRGGFMVHYVGENSKRQVFMNNAFSIFG